MGEMLPEAASPLAWSMVWEPCAAQGWRDALIGRFGFDDSEIDADQPETIRSIDGHAYINVSVLNVLAQRCPPMSEGHIDMLLAGGSGLVPVHRSEQWHEADPVTGAMLEQWHRWVVQSRNQVELEQLAQTVDSVISERCDVESMSDFELVDTAVGLQPLARTLFDQQLNQLLASTVGPTLIYQMCNLVGQPAHALQLLSGLGGIRPVSPTLALWELSRLVRGSSTLQTLFAGDLDRLNNELGQASEADAKALAAGVGALVTEVGYRGDREWDFASPTWDESPHDVLAIVASLKQCGDVLAPQLRQRDVIADKKQAVTDISVALADDQRQMFADAVASSAVFLRGRETCRHYLVRVVHRMRQLLRELGRRGVDRGDFGTAGDVWMLTADEAVAYVDGGLGDLRHLTALRRAEHDVVRSRNVPEFIDDAGTDNNAAVGLRQGYQTPLTGPLEAGDVILGSPASPGTISGPATVLSDNVDLADVNPGDVVVLKQPSLIASSIFVVAGAVVCDVGGPLSHAAVIARELGTPMVVGAAGASQRIADGMVLNVDGSTGVVSFEGTLRNEERIPSPYVA